MTDSELGLLRRTDPAAWAAAVSKTVSAPIAAPTPVADRVVTEHRLMSAMKILATNIAGTIAPMAKSIVGLDARVAAEFVALDQRMALLEAIDKQITPLSTRLAAVETRVGALCMLGGKAMDRLPELESSIERGKGLEARIEELEERAPLGYGGTLTDGQQANKGFFYTAKGSIWYCRETTRDKPGTSADFQLACKKGQDAK